MMKRLTLSLVFVVLLAACRPSEKPAGMPTVTTQSTFAATATAPAARPTPSVGAIRELPLPTATIEADAWVDNPTPAQGSTIVVRGGLIKDGVRLGGIMMYATWPEKGGMAAGNSLVTYGSGKCPIVVADYTPGVFVPVTVTFYYQDVTYTAHTGFTPR